MTTEAIIMMVSVLTIIWGGFIAMLIFASREENKQNKSGGNSESES